MHLQQLADLINDQRASDLLLTLNSGKHLRLELEATAIVQDGIDHLYVIWPIDGDFTHVRKGMILAPANVSSIEYVPPAASEAA